MMMAAPAGAAMPAAGAPAGGGAAPAAEEEKEPERTIFDVKLEEFPAAKKISVIKEVRGLLGLGLKEAKALVEKTPTVLKEDVPKVDCDVLIEKLTAIGCKIELV